MHRFGVLLLMTAVTAGRVFAGAVLAPIFSSHYTVVDLGVPTGGMGVTVLVDPVDPLELLISRGGEIDLVGVTRDPASGHITGYTGATSTLYTSAPADGGMAYAPNGAFLYITAAPTSIGEIKAGATSATKTVNIGVSDKDGGGGGLNFVPSGFNGAGNLVVAVYGDGTVCVVAPMTADGNGTYNFSNPGCASGETTTVGGRLNGIAYVPLGSPLFSGPSVLVSQYSNARVLAFLTDANGLPDTSSQQDFMTGASIYGMSVDPVTGDMLMIDWQHQTLLEVNGFVPEPATFILAGAALAILGKRKIRLV
ncbi:MAG: hypothetical protein ABSH44_21390 [Bryobacteraceae bacterium]|jgi:hypothetical protein